MFAAVGCTQQLWPLSHAPPPSRNTTRCLAHGWTLTARPVEVPLAQRESGKSIHVHSSGRAPRLLPPAVPGETGAMGSDDTSSAVSLVHPAIASSAKTAGRSDEATFLRRHHHAVGGWITLSVGQVRNWPPFPWPSPARSPAR